NTALGGSGGGIYNGGGHVDMQSDTIASNVTDDGNGGGSGGGLSNASGVFSIFNSIVAKNSAGSGADVSGPFQSQGYNLIGKVDLNNASGFNANDRFSTSVPVDVGLEPLSDNGGPTPTQNLSDGSPALDGGGTKVDLSQLSADVLASLSHDQRG